MAPTSLLTRQFYHHRRALVALRMMLGRTLPQAHQIQQTTNFPKYVEKWSKKRKAGIGMSLGVIDGAVCVLHTQPLEDGSIPDHVRDHLIMAATM